MPVTVIVPVITIIMIISIVIVPFVAIHIGSAAHTPGIGANTKTTESSTSTGIIPYVVLTNEFPFGSFAGMVTLLLSMLAFAMVRKTREKEPKTSSSSQERV